MKTKPITYGEAYTAVKESLMMVKGDWITIKKPIHRDQMDKDSASKYYTKKLKKIWGNIYKEAIPDRYVRARFIKEATCNSRAYRVACHRVCER